MFDLEQSITAWRANFARTRLTPDTVAELEGHLRDVIAALTRAGTDAAEAFRVAQSRLGKPESIRQEFRKANRRHRGPINFLAGLWVALLVAFTVFILSKLRSGQDTGLLLAAHIVALTAGYFAVLVSGGFGICHAAFQLLHRLSPSRENALIHGIRLFNVLAAITVLLGTALGVAWSAHNPVIREHVPAPEMIALVMVRSLRECGSFAVCAWLAVMLMLQKSRPDAARVLVPMSIAGNILVGLAWFGPFFFLPSYHGFNKFWPVETVMALHFVFLMLALLRQPAPQAQTEN